MQINRLKIFAVLGVLMLAGCAQTPPSPKFPEMTFRHLAPLSLQVADIQLVSETEHGIDAPHVGHRFPTPPEKALKRWAEDRLQVAGSSNTARFIIIVADAVEDRLKVDTGVTGVFKRQQSEQYTVNVEARLEILDRRGVRKAFASANATRSTTVGEDISLDGRHQQWFELVEKLMAEFDKTMEIQIRKSLTEFLL